MYEYAFSDAMVEGTENVEVLSVCASADAVNPYEEQYQSSGLGAPEALHVV